MKYSYYYIEMEIGSEVFTEIILPDLEAKKDKRYKIQKILNCEFIDENLKRKINLYLNLKGDNNV